MNRLLRVLAVALVALGIVVVPSSATAAAPTVPGVDCTNPPMSHPYSGQLGIDPGPEQWRDGDPFAKDAKVSKYEVYGFAGLEWVNYDLGCGPDAVRDAESTFAGSMANLSWTSLLTAASATTAIERWAYAPTTLDIFEPVQRIAAEAFGSRVFWPIFGTTLLGIALFLSYRSRRGDVAEASNVAGWGLLVMVLAIAALLWPTRIGPAADDTVTGMVGMVNEAVAGSDGGNLTIADANAANLEHGVLYSTWASGTFGRYSGDAVEKYGPALFRNGALTRTEAKLLETDPERAADIIEKKKERFRAAAENLKDEDPVAYEYLAGKQNWSRLGFAALGWVGFLCTSAFHLVASLILLFALTVVRVAVMVLPLLAIFGAIYPARGAIIKLFDYTAGALFSAVMFGSVAAIFTAVAGGIMAPTTNTPPLLAAVMLLIFSIAAWKLTKPARSIKAFGAPGLKRFRGQMPPADAPKGKPGEQPAPQQFPAGRTAEASRPSAVRSVVTGGLTGAAAGVGLAAVTGGASLAAGAAAGAARGAAAEGVGAVTGSALAANAAGAAVGKALPAAPARALPAAPARALPVGTTPAEAPAPAAGTQAAAPTRSVVEGARIYRPGEAAPAADSLTVTKADKGVYPIYRSEARQ